MEFDSKAVEDIGYYVYAYSDPDTLVPFYIGKGKGNRCFDHIEDRSESKKVERLKDLRRAGKEPLIELVRYGLTDNEASLLEAAIIDYVGLTKLTNKVRGLHSRSFGRMTVGEVILKYSAEDAVIIDDGVLLITIGQSYTSGMSSPELYEYTRGVWRIGDRRNRARLALAVFQGIVREVYEISRWHKAGTLAYKYRLSAEVNRTNRWEFEGRQAEESTRSRYYRKSVRRYMSPGSRNPIHYVNCN